MKKHTFSFGMIILLASAQHSFGRSIFRAEDDDLFASMRNQMKQVFQSMEEALDNLPVISISPKINVKKDLMPSISQDDKMVYISLKADNVDADAIKVKRIKEKRGNTLNIEVPVDSTRIEMVVGKNYMSLTAREEIKEETKKDENSSTYVSVGSAHVLQSLPCDVIFDDVKAEYNEDAQTLTISLQKADPTETDDIPVQKK